MQHLGEDGEGPAVDQAAIASQASSYVLPIVVVSLVVQVVYQVAFLTRKGATPGKMAVGIAVRRRYGHGGCFGVRRRLGHSRFGAFRRLRRGRVGLCHSPVLRQRDGLSGRGLGSALGGDPPADEREKAAGAPRMLVAAE